MTLTKKGLSQFTAPLVHRFKYLNIFIYYRMNKFMNFTECDYLMCNTHKVCLDETNVDEHIKSNEGCMITPEWFSIKKTTKARKLWLPPSIVDRMEMKIAKLPPMEKKEEGLPPGSIVIGEGFKWRS